ncbi:MAG: general stress protein CsbD [Bacteroidota bacterium]
MSILRSWREQKAMLKLRFPVLSDRDFELEDKDRETMLSRLAQKLSKTRPELELIFADLQKH